MSPSISITDADEIFIESAAGGIFIHTTEDGMLELTSTGAGGIQVRSSGSWGTAISAEGTGGLYLSTEATSGELSLAVGSGGLLMGGADVAASDASAHMTVGGTQYSIAKAIKVKIGADTYYWPLFGPA